MIRICILMCHNPAKSWVEYVGIWFMGGLLVLSKPIIQPTQLLAGMWQYSQHWVWTCPFVQNDWERREPKYCDEQRFNFLFYNYSLTEELFIWCWIGIGSDKNKFFYFGRLPYWSSSILVIFHYSFLKKPFWRTCKKICFSLTFPWGFCFVFIFVEV